MAAHEEELQVIEAAAKDADGPSLEPPGIISATALAKLLSGDVALRDLAAPLPERPSSSRRLGTEIHRLIEERAREGDPEPEEWVVLPYADETELDEPGRADEREAIAARLEQWVEDGWPDRTPALLPSGEPMVELPFIMRWDGRIVRGRVDAVYETDGGGFEIVDFKTGARFTPSDSDQLVVYARALKAMGLLPANRPVKLTYAFLDGGPPVSREMSV